MQTSSQPPIDVRALSRFLRIVFFVMVLSVILYGVVIAEVKPQLQSPPPGSMKTALSVLAALAGLAVLYLRFSKIGALLRSEEHTSELQSRGHLVCRLLLEKKKKMKIKQR